MPLITHPIEDEGITDKFGYFRTIVNVKEIPKAEINPNVAPNITEPLGAFSELSDPPTAREIPHTAKIKINHESNFCFSFKIKTDSSAVKRGIVASAVKTTITEVSLIPRVKLTELTAIANIMNNPGIENAVRNSFLRSFFFDKNQIRKRVMPISTPRHPPNCHFSSSDSLIKRVSGVNRRTPKKARKSPLFLSSKVLK
jgi:hypothetical protein